MKFLLFGWLALLCLCSFAQKYNCDFQYKKTISDGVIVSFEVIEKNNTIPVESLENIFKQKPDVLSAQFVISGTIKYFKLKIKEHLSADQVREILRQNGFDFNDSSIIKSQIATEHYPVFKDTGNPQADHDRYEKDKQEWIKNYPEEVEIMTGRKISDAVIELPADFPKYEKTGNETEDAILYEKAKKEWHSKQQEIK
ncbi:MAG: hypothetical protein A2275_10970 [Bacteroidetes bacterium RIFOXYA12_FULL_35_11]|nr:MAG: hypothetical protein A2X01_08440 [Bacteroidetes bacterium GWF2_35_48]OFY74595.1 MAG: hypothetical protein A2275_10970 [Bacteroidetes bacterium RIFOXYA12_FULL_35_11]OFY93306.1 MAG: hypothetical protein A2309_08065 [Bacteroidetes bacterium RIFOXYB2_FULL_35_7]OFY95404.1 MAG: hypothetical protein A2491_04285 [Bacteroidetes bacterium RIFOXYC12_FULL_35_7]